MEKIAQAEAQALQEVRDQAIEMALAATAKLIGVEVPLEQVRDAVEATARKPG